MSKMKRQAGISSITLLLIIVVIAFFGLCSFKLAPLYMSNFTLNSTLKNIDTPAGQLNRMTLAEVRATMGKAFTVNNVPRQARDFHITREGGKTTIALDYEERVPLIYNIDIVATFHAGYTALQ
jgi:Domain of unknown function (DUF4845)